MATTSAQRGQWVTTFRANLDALIAAAQAIRNSNDDYVNQGLSGTLAVGDLVGSNSNLAVADITTAEGNAILLANCILDNLGHTVSSGVSATIFAIK